MLCCNPSHATRPGPGTGMQIGRLNNFGDDRFQMTGQSGGRFGRGSQWHANYPPFRWPNKWIIAHAEPDFSTISFALDVDLHSDSVLHIDTYSGPSSVYRLLATGSDKSICFIFFLFLSISFFFGPPSFLRLTFSASWYQYTCIVLQDNRLPCRRLIYH